MNEELRLLLSENLCYKNAYDFFLEMHRSNYESTPKELAEFDLFRKCRIYARSFNWVRKSMD